MQSWRLYYFLYTSSFLLNLRATPPHDLLAITPSSCPTCCCSSSSSKFVSYCCLHFGRPFFTPTPAQPPKSCSRSTLLYSNLFPWKFAATYFTSKAITQVCSKTMAVLRIRLTQEEDAIYIYINSADFNRRRNFIIYRGHVRKNRFYIRTLPPVILIYRVSL